jgi:hypothetical protein
MKPGDRRPNEPITIELDHTAVEGQARVRPELSNNYRNAGSYEYGPVQELRLRDYLGIIEKRKGMVALLFLLFIGLTAANTILFGGIKPPEEVFEGGNDSSI